MIIKLNLLDSSRKKNVIKNIHYISMANNLILLTIIIVLISILILSGQKYLEHTISNFNNISINTPLDQKIIKINKEINQVEIIQKDYVKWSRVLTNFLLLIPEGNTIRALRFDKENKKTFISGKANTRNDFLKLKESLEKSDLVSNIKSPISNLLYKTNIDFTLEATLNL